MPYKTFTDDEIAKLKATSAKDHAASAQAHGGRILRVDLDPPIAETVMVAPFSRAEYADFYDRCETDPQTAYHAALLSQVLYPDLAAIEALRQSWASVPETVADELVEEAGFTIEPTLTRVLDPLALPRGLAKNAAEKLIADAKGARLWSVELPPMGLSCVMQTPLADVWLAGNTAMRDARGRRSGIVAAIEPYVLGSIVWSAEPLIGGAGLLDRRPRLIFDLWAAFKRMGGDGVRARRKSL